MHKFQLLEEIPWLCGRLDEPGVAQRRLAQYDDYLGARHHRVSHEFFGHGPDSLRQYVEAILPYGSNISERLRLEIRSIAMPPMDDSVCESPHAQAKHIVQTNRGRSWEWLAATMRFGA